MMNIVRADASAGGRVEAPAEQVFALLTDWAGIERWAPPELKSMIEGVVLEGAPDAVPRARVLHMASGAIMRETLIACDHDACRIYYTLGNGGMPGVRNYVATATVDPAGADACTLTVSSTFDIDDPALGAEGGRQFFNGLYQAIVAGFLSYFVTNA